MNFKLPPFDHEEDSVKRITAGKVSVMDPSVLLRPQRLPRNALIVAGIATLIAAAVGGYAAWQGIDAVLHSDERRAAAIEESLSRDVALDVPQIEEYLPFDDATIKQSFIDAGYTIFDVNEQNPEDGLDLVKLPEGVSAADAALVMADVEHADSAAAVRVLNGAWRFACTRTDYVDIRVKYADFKSGNAQSAIDNALADQGWLVDGGIAEGIVLGESGVDEVGNTYQEGTITIDSGTYQWRVSTCELKYIYDINGVPETAMYVVVRITA